MTIGELLALLGRAWPRLLIYPGGLAAFGLLWLIWRAPPWAPARRDAPVDAGALLLSTIAAPWLGLAFLPLPGAGRYDLAIDAPVALALLEWPLLVIVAGELRRADEREWRCGAARLAAALNGYPPLILSLLLLALSGGTLRLDEMAAAPGGAPAALAAHWLGAAGLALALPPLLGLGPFHAGSAPAGLRLRALGLVALASLPWLALVTAQPWWGALAEDRSARSALASLLLPLPPLLLVLALLAFHRLARGDAASWARRYLVLDGLLLLALAGAAAGGLAGPVVQATP